MEGFNTFSVKENVVIVTGVSSGIGQCIAVELSNLGAIVIGIGRDPKRLEETKRTLHNSDIHYFFKADLTNDKELTEFVEKVVQLNLKIDGLVHCAGISSTILLKSINSAKIGNHFEVNVFGPLVLTRDLLKKRFNLFNPGSSIVVISSVMENHGAKGKTLYGMTKGAIASGVKSLAIELAEKKIRVNSIAPGVVDTPLSQASFYRSTPETLKMVTEMHPLGIGSPSDVAFSTIFLLSKASKWITGTSIVVDGGYTSL